MSSGLDDLERRGRWGRAESADKAGGTGSPDTPPRRTPPAAVRSSRRSSRRKPKAEETPPEPVSSAGGVERVVVYLTREQAAWIRERQIEALRSGRRVSTSQLIRDVMNSAIEKHR